MEVTRDQILAKWYEASKQLEDAKELEMSLRKEVVAYFFPNPKLGVNRHELPNDFSLMFDYKENVSIDLKAFDALCETAEAEELGISKTDVLKYKPEFNESLFKKLTPVKQAFVEQCLTRKPAAPSLKVENKGKK